MDEGVIKLLRERGYNIQHTLGEGAYSKVKSAFSTRLRKDVAIKCINTKLAPRDFVEKFLPRELQTLPLLRHDNIVRVYEILEASDGFVYIIMEAASNGDMLRYVQRRGALPEPEIRKYFWQLCQAINYCHRHNICHRDLKCENLLLDKDFKLLLTDFGFSKSMTYGSDGQISLSSTFCGSAAYAAPEIIQGRPYDPRMHDIWSLGVILYIMSCGHMPFDDSNVKRMLKVQLRNQLKFPSRISDSLSVDLKHLIRNLIQPDVTQRITMEKILRHPFLDDYRERNRASSSASTVAQHIYEFFTGRPRSSQRRHSSHGNEHAEQPTSSQRRHSRTFREDRRHSACCERQPSSREPYDRRMSSPCNKRCCHHRRSN